METKKTLIIKFNLADMVDIRRISLMIRWWQKHLNAKLNASSTKLQTMKELHINSTNCTMTDNTLPSLQASQTLLKPKYYMHTHQAKLFKRACNDKAPNIIVKKISDTKKLTHKPTKKKSKITRKLNNNKDLQTLTIRTPCGNCVLPQLAVKYKIETEYCYQTFAQVENIKFLNHQWHQHVKPYKQLYNV